MERTIYREIKITGLVWLLGAVLGALIAGAGASVLHVEHHGHIVTGMNNQIVWGVPHVFAIFLIVAASGALNVASIASVFGQAAYKPLSRLSSLLALALLAGGLAVLVLDLGRPDRLIVAMTKYNFSSIFAWNIYLYTGFFAVVAAYLYVQMARGTTPQTVRVAGTIAFVWRLALTTGTGSIFGWLVARPGYDAAIMAPLFISMSFSFGLAAFILVSLTLCLITGRDFGPLFLDRLGRLLGLFAALVIYLTVVQHLTNLYAAEHSGIEKFVLFEGGIYTSLFWVGQIFLGGVAPILLTLRPGKLRSSASAIAASLLVIAGGIAQVYVIVIGGQAFPLDIFPGFEASSSFYDGQIANYTPTVVEISLGVGGIALALAITGFAAIVLRILPTNLSDENVGSAAK